ncbi:MAG: translocation/assembly module TamB domain-containing protein [Ferruginibacter sp.]
MPNSNDGRLSMAQNTILKKSLRIFLYIIGVVLLLVCAVIFFISVPFGKRVVKNQVQSYLQSKLKTKVEIGAVDYALPKWIEIKNVFIQDQNKDTLLYGEQLNVDVDMFKLIRGNTEIKKIVFKNILINITRKESDTAFNFQFVMNAFTGNKPTAKVNPDTAELKLTLDRLVFNNVGLRFKDDYAGNSFVTRIKNLDATLNKFQPDRLRFGIDDFYADSVSFFMNSIKAPKVDSSKEQFKDSIKKEGYDLFITANNFNVREVFVTVDNKYNGMYYANDVKHLGLNTVVYDVQRSYATANTLILDSSFIQFTSPKIINEKDKDTSATVPWLIKAGEVSLKNNKFRYDDSNAPKAGGLDFAHLDAEGIRANIGSFIFSVDSTAAMVNQLSFKDKSGFTLDSGHVRFLFTDTVISAKELYLRTPQTLLQNSLEIRYDSVAGIKKYPANSTVSALLNNSTIAFNDLYLLMPSLTKTFPPAQFRNNTIRFNTELRGSLKQLYLPYLQLKGLSGSTINARGTLFNLTDPERFSYDLYILNSRIRKEDLLKFVPAENQLAFKDLPSVLDFSGHLTGDKNNLNGDVNARGDGIAFQGRIGLRNISDPLRIQYDLAITNGSIGRGFIMGFIPPGSLPPNINLPERINASGLIKGDKNNLTLNAKLNTSYGGATVKGFIRNMKDPQRALYDLFITTNSFHLGKLLSDTSLGVATLNATAKGRGFDYKTMQSGIKANISQLVYNKYNYRNADIISNFNNGRISGEGNIKDSSIRLNFTGEMDVRGEYPALNAFVRVDTVQLKRLNLYDSTLNLSLTANIRSNNLRPRNMDASAIIDSIKIQMNNDYYSLDTVSLIATSQNGIDDINLASDFADININGAFDYDKIGPELLQYIDHYYSIVEKPSTVTAGNQQVSAKGTIRSHPLVKGLVPGLEDYADIDFTGSYSSALADSALNFKATVPYVLFQGNKIRNGNFDIASRNERINYKADFDTLNFGTNTFFGTTFNGSAANDSLSVNVITQDNKRRDWFGLNGSMYVNDITYSFRLKDRILLNYEAWNVAPDNYISYGPQGIIVNNFAISSDTSRIFISSRQPIANSPIDISIDNFNLRSITSIVSKDTLFATGVMDAKLAVTDLEKKLPGFTGNAQISDLTVMNQPIGTVTFTAEKLSSANVAATLNISGNGNNISAKGNYYLNNEQQQFDADVNIQQLNFATLQGFSGGSIKNASGNMHGNLVLNGKFTDPRWNGELNFDTTKFSLAQFGTPYKINNQKITLSYPDISFNNFIVLDSLNNKMAIDGDISSNTMYNYDLDLDINAVDFIMINAPKAVDNQFYGFASVDAFILIKGNSESPDIEGDIFVNDNSDLTIVLPERSFNKDESKTVVRFIDRDTFVINPPVDLFQQANESANNFGKYLNYNLNIGVNKNAKLAIIIDPVTGDEIRVQGDAQLNAGVDPGGNIILAGNYDLDQGSYVLNYQFLQRKFKLIRGSTIAFVGEPMNARINITAEYIANTSAKDLLFNEVGSVDPVLSNSFNQKIPFRVLLYLTGELSKPEINFDVQLPDENTAISSELRTTIENKLTQLRGDQSATNKQVFSLLLFNRFVGEQSSDFFKGNGGGFNDLARQSVSQFLSEALNEIASNLFKGIDIDLNLNSYQDYRYGGNQQRTDLNVALSKTFLDDRLTVSIGTNIGIEGQDPAAKAGKGNSGFTPDVNLSYKLTKDGKYMIRGYRRNQFEVVLDGYVVETGLGFVVTMDYDKFRELFGKRKRAAK